MNRVKQRQKHLAQACISDIYSFLNEKIVIIALLSFILLLIIVRTTIPKYWEFDYDKNFFNKPNWSTGITKDGSPWIGSENAELVIKVFSDYLCFQCKKMHYYLQNIVSENPDKVQLIFYHFPMDHQVNPLVKNSFHENSAILSKLAIYANLMGEFPVMHNLLYAVPRNQKLISIGSYAEKAGLIPDYARKAIKLNQIELKLNYDIRLGVQKGVKGTPAFEINGKLYHGTIPYDILKYIIE